MMPRVYSCMHLSAAIVLFFFAASIVCAQATPPSVVAAGDGVVIDEKRIAIPPAPMREVVDEEYVLSSDRPERWGKGTHLKGCMGPGTVLPDALVPGSVHVVLAEGGDDMSAGKDYLIDQKWAALGRIDGGRIEPDAKVRIGYS